MNIEQTQNQAIGRSGYKPEAIVIHICEGTLAGTVAWFKNPRSIVSAHYIVGKDGSVTQMVAPENTAWHAGLVKNPTWPLIKKGINPNLYTIGIENEGFATEAPTLLQFYSLVRLVQQLAAKFNIALDEKHIIPHHSIRADKTCPGPYFDTKTIVSLANFK
jgi:N-acetyl-anhydromuramyl-L-alanine amidase AmpD